MAPRWVNRQFCLLVVSDLPGITIARCFLLRTYLRRPSDPRVSTQLSPVDRIRGGPRQHDELELQTGRKGTSMTHLSTRVAALSVVAILGLTQTVGASSTVIVTGSAVQPRTSLVSVKV